MLEIHAYFGPHFWNSLPSEIKIFIKLNEFKLHISRKIPVMKIICFDNRFVYIQFEHLGEVLASNIPICVHFIMTGMFTIELSFRFRRVCQHLIFSLKKYNAMVNLLQTSHIVESKLIIVLYNKVV